MAVGCDNFVQFGFSIVAYFDIVSHTSVLRLVRAPMDICPSSELPLFQVSN